MGHKACWGHVGLRRRSKARLRLTQVLVDRGGRPSALVDGPHDEGLASPAVARSVDALDGGLVVLGAGLAVVAPVERDAQRLGHGGLWVAEAHREDDEVRWPLLLGALHLLEVAVGADGHLHGAHRRELAVCVAEELPREDRVGARVVAEAMRGLLVPVVGAQDARPHGPRVAGGAVLGWTRKELEVDQRGAAVPAGEEAKRGMRWAAQGRGGDGEATAARGGGGGGGGGEGRQRAAASPGGGGGEGRQRAAVRGGGGGGGGEVCELWGAGVRGPIRRGAWGPGAWGRGAHRSEVAMQSVPVSPPPMTTTCLPVASMMWPSYLETRCALSPRARGSAKRRCWFLVRKSMANMTPSSCRPGMGRLLGTVDPIASTVASKSPVSSAASAPTSELHWKLMPSASIRSTRRCTVSLLSFMLGMP